MAALYGEIKRLMDPRQLRLITSLEKQITPFSSDPWLLAWPAISELWKEQEKREREASDSRVEPSDFQRSKNLKSAWQKGIRRS